MQVLGSGKDYIDKECAVTILSYDLLAKRVSELESFNYKIIIFDESHLVKSIKPNYSLSVTCFVIFSKIFI